jgi:hypothetical protein
MVAGRQWGIYEFFLARAIKIAITKGIIANL